MDFSPEISDLIVDYDPETLARRPVKRADVLARLEEARNPAACRIAARLPARDGVLDEAAVDATLVRAHLELQRLHEEFEMERTLRTVLRALVAAIRDLEPGRRVRVVDLGCGLGYVVRWLAASGGLGDVELVGADYNAALTRGAARLAEREQLGCRFLTANAFRLDEPATVFTSTGVLHHFRGEALTRVFSEQNCSPALAMVHFDIRPSWAAPIGAWIFHRARMREPLARHDGTLSAVRAHPAATLRAAMRAGAPGMVPFTFDARVPLLPLLTIMHAALGVRPPLVEPFRSRLGAQAARLEPAS